MVTTVSIFNGKERVRLAVEPDAIAAERHARAFAFEMRCQDYVTEWFRTKEGHYVVDVFDEDDLAKRRRFKRKAPTSRPRIAP